MPSFAQRSQKPRPTAPAGFAAKSASAHRVDRGSLPAHGSFFFSLYPAAFQAKAGPIQAKPVVSQARDDFEQQADSVSEQVMRMPDPQRPEPNGARPEDPRALPRRVGAKPAPGNAGVPAPPVVHQVLAAAGRPLDAEARQFVEPRFGQDFGHVRIHTDAEAAASAASIDARAYTAGHHVVFGAGEYRPGTAEGRRLVAHELTHVAQQAASSPPQGSVIQRDAAATEDPKVTALKTELVRSFGLAAVSDTAGAKWSTADLEKMKRALARIPAAELVALRGVRLVRVATTTEFGNTADGLFTQKIAPLTGVRDDVIEIASSAFDLDEDYDQGGAHTIFGGQTVLGAPSEGVLSHEVGHAVEAFAQRQAEKARILAGIADKAGFDSLTNAQKAYNAAIAPSIAVPAWSNAKEHVYMNAIITAQKKLDAITSVMTSASQTPTAAESKKIAADVAVALGKARIAMATRDVAHNALPTGSTYALPTEEATQDTWLAAAVAIVPVMEARATAQKAAEDTQGVEDATGTTVKVSSGNKVKMTLRLAEFVALIEANGIDIRGAGLGNHVTSHWPDNPEEAYAELYSLSVTAPEGLKKFDKKSVVATYFSSPVGLKGPQKAQAATWLASHH